MSDGRVVVVKLGAGGKWYDVGAWLNYTDFEDLVIVVRNEALVLTCKWL